MQINSAKPGIHDSSTAQNHASQRMYFEKNAEGERVVEWFNSHFGLKMSLRWDRLGTVGRGKVMGRCRPVSQQLSVDPTVAGGSVATLLHEIAHQVEWKRSQRAGHGPTFHKIQDEILELFDLHAHEMILGSQPTLRCHAERVIKKARARGVGEEEVLRGYIMMLAIETGQQLDENELLDAVVEAL